MKKKLKLKRRTLLTLNAFDVVGAVGGTSEATCPDAGCTDTCEGDTCKGTCGTCKGDDSCNVSCGGTCSCGPSCICSGDEWSDCPAECIP